MIEQRTQQQINECRKGQLELTKAKGYPHFAPMSGRCFKCNRDIYQAYMIGDWESKGINVERASKELITGCPHCNRSYCD